MFHGNAFHGTRRKLVLAFDVGTTYSGISYSILDPGRVPEIKAVTKFPAHEYVSGASKIPTIIYYDQTGKVRAVGAEAMIDGIHEMAEEEQWVKAEWFKLHLRSKFGAGKDITKDIPPLPLDKTVVDVFSDFLKYLLACTSAYIQATQANGVDLWKSVVGNIDFVLSHPNGWEGTEQSQMRKAAVLAGLIQDDVKGHARLSFVTEGEASLHFAIRNGLPDGTISKGEGIVIVDAGGGTIDVSSYSKNIQTSNGTFEELTAPRCYFSGSVFVSIHARHFLTNFLSDSPFADDIDHIVGIFDKATKLRFKDAKEPQYVKFGSTRDNDPTCNVRFGQLKILGSDVALFFQPSVECIIGAVLEQRKMARKPISQVILVGGFAASEWLYKQVHAKLLPNGLNISVPEGHVNKAVSDGAISFYLDHFVRTRVSKFTYGILLFKSFNPANPDHKKREADSYIYQDGSKRITQFHAILPRNTQIAEDKEFRTCASRDCYSEEEFKNARFRIFCYRGLLPRPKWTELDPENYTITCIIEANLSYLPLTLGVNEVTGRAYYKLICHVILLFGLTEMKAQIAWTEDGVEKRTPAKLIHEPDAIQDTP